MEVSTLDERFQKMIQAALEAKSRAYCPYSNFHVGSAVLTADGSIFAGCNVENASYGLCVCAERTAIMNAVSNGHQKFEAAAVACDVKGSFKGPCGACRQVFAEFNMDLNLYLVKPDMTYKIVVLRDLLPMAFSPETLEEERV